MEFTTFDLVILNTRVLTSVSYFIVITTHFTSVGTEQIIQFWTITISAISTFYLEEADP